MQVQRVTLLQFLFGFICYGPKLNFFMFHVHLYNQEVTKTDLLHILSDWNLGELFQIKIHLLSYPPILFSGYFMLCSAKSQDSSQAICPIYIHVCPPITEANRNKATCTCTRKKPVQEFHSFIFITLYGRKINYYCRVRG